MGKRKLKQKLCENKAAQIKNNALLAKLGDVGAISELWGDCIHLVKHICNKYQPHPSSGNRICEWEDLISASYIAFRKCILKWSPQDNASFTTFLVYYIKEACRVELGYFRRGVKVDALPSATSYDIPLSDTDSDSFLELIIDDMAAKEFEQVEISDMQQLIRAEVSLLPDLQRDIIHLRYFEGMFRHDVAKMLGVAKNTVINNERRAFETLRRRKTLQSLYAEFVSIDYEANTRTDSTVFRYSILDKVEPLAILRMIFREDALEIFM